MTTTVMYGPDGKPLITNARAAVSAADPDAAGQEVAKRVRSQATTLTSVWDPRRGKPKPTPVSFDTLRMMGNRNEWVRAIIKTRKNQIGRVPWSIVPKEEEDRSPATEKLCAEVTRLFQRPSMRGSRPHSRSWRQFIGEVLEDLLVLDAGAIEKEWTKNRWIAALYPVDGSTIRPNLDERGGFHDDAYVQLVEGQVTARFGLEDLVYIMDNPMTDIRFAGFGYSPLEHLIVSVTAELYASKYNQSYFEKGSVPEGLLNLGEDAAPEDIDAFRLYWMNEVMGKPWAIPIVGGKGVEWQPWRQSNRDMEYMAYQQWLLKKLCAVYQIPPQEIGELEDVNRSTAQDQSSVNQSKSIQPILTLLADYIEAEIIGEHGLGVGDYIQFKWDEDEDEAAVHQRYGQMIPMGAATRNEYREALGMDPAEHEGADEHLTDGSPKPLPTHEDMAQMGAASQAEQQRQQMEQMQGAAPPGGPQDIPFQPGGGGSDGDNQDTDRAQLAFQGVGKTAPEGRDRNPAMSREQAKFEGVWERRQDELLRGLSEILELPPLDEDGDDAR